MNVSIWWIPVAGIAGLIVGGLGGGYLASRGCKKKLAELEEERKQETREMEEIMSKYDKKLDADEKKVDKKLAKDMKEVKKPVKSKATSRRVEDHPVRISEDEYNSDMEQGRDTESLTYYRRDSVLAGQNDEQVDDPVDLIGKDVWESLDIVEDETLYVRNFGLEMDFEINIDPSLSFYRDVASV